MKWKNFFKGLKIIEKYLTEEEKNSYSIMDVGHEELYIIKPKNMTKKDVDEMKELNWLICDEDEEYFMAFI